MGDYSDILFFVSNKHGNTIRNTARNKLHDVSLCNDFIIVMAGIIIDCSRLEFASCELRKNYDIVISAVSICPCALQYVNEVYWDNYEVAVRALSNTKYAYWYIMPITKQLQYNPNIILLSGNIPPLLYYESSAKKMDIYAQCHIKVHFAQHF